MLFSVCIPVYNTSEYLNKCLESVLNQTEKDYEIILMDDGSTDGSGDICDAYAEKYPNIRVFHKENEGLMMTRRRGFENARGDFFISLDSDDFLCCNSAFEKIRAMIERENCDLVMYDYIAGKEFSADDKRIAVFDREDGYVFSEEEKDEVYRRFLLGKGLNSMWIKAVSRTIVDLETDYSVWKDDICRGEDMLQTYPLLTNAKRIGYIRQPLVHYRWTPGSISNNPRLQFYKAYRSIFKREDEYLPLWNLDEDTVKKAKLRRIPQILNVIITGYHRSKSAGKLCEWKAFIRAVSKDEFFGKLYPDEFAKDISLYYRVLGKLIMANNTFVLAGILDAYRLYSEKIKRKR